MNTLDKKYTDLLQDILDNGTIKRDRTGTGTISVFNRTIRHKMSEGFPLLTTKKMYFKGIVTELIWFLRGDTNIKYLVDNDCHIWVGDTYKNYCISYKDGHEFYEDEEIKRSLTQEEFIEKIKTDDEFANKWGNLGPIYGKQWRSWNNYKGDEIAPNGFEMWNEPIDQIANLINEVKKNPDSRRLIVNAWNVGEIDQMTLSPCHYAFQLYTRELTIEERAKIAKYNSKFISPITVESWDKNNVPKRAISLSWKQRSVDTFLGLPFNIASYGLLLEIIAKEVNMIPDELIGNLDDTHIYLNHIEQAKEQIGRPLSFPERYKLWKGFDVPSTFQLARMWDAIQMMDYDGIQKHTREPLPLPKLIIENEVKWLQGDCLPYYSPNHFKLENYQSHPKIEAPLSN